jgi:hypothetical protein
MKKRWGVRPTWADSGGQGVILDLGNRPPVSQSKVSSVGVAIDRPVVGLKDVKLS